MNHFALALSAVLLHFVWQGLLVAFSLWVGLRLLRSRLANTRYLASCAALAALAALPVFTTLMVYYRPLPRGVAK